MRAVVGWSVVVSLLGLALLAGAAGAQEKKVDVEKLPRAVADAVKTKFPGAKLVGASTEKEGDKTVYEVSIKHKGSNIDVTLEPDGKIVSVEKEIAAKDLPKAVRTALEAKFAGATYKKVEEITKDREVTYEVLLVTSGKKTLEVVFDPKGKLVKQEEKKEKDKD